MQGRTGREFPFYKVRDVSAAWNAGSMMLLETENSLSAEEAASIRAKPIPAGSIVFAKIGEALRLNRRAITNTPCLIDNNMMGIWASSDFLDSQYLFWFSTITRFDTDARASVVPSIRKSDISELQFSLPPRTEQARIVEKLESLLADLDAGVAELKAAQRKLAQYRQSLLKAAVEGALTADWRATHAPQETGAQLLARILRERRARFEQKHGPKKKYKEPAAPDTSQLPALPEGWVWATIDQCALDENSITDGPFGSNLKTEHYTDAGPLVIRLHNIGDGEFLDARAHISEAHYEQLQKHAVREGDLVVAMLGETLPRACIVPFGIAPAIVKADCARIRPNTEFVPPEFLVAVLNAEPTRKRVISLVKGIGRPRVNLANIRAITIPIPPLPEQHQILTQLDTALSACEAQETAIAHALKQAAAQRRNLLRAAFIGQLVPQDPADEPASALLARIRAERAAQGTARKPRGRKKKEAV
jgi:type I restriction enzyme S subunit